MGVTDRWVRKLLKRMSKRGDAAVVHGLRGRASNRKIGSQTQKRAIEVLKQAEWHDFGPTFASEQLTTPRNGRISFRSRNHPLPARKWDMPVKTEPKERPIIRMLLSACDDASLRPREVEALALSAYTYAML